jgi:archaellum component FlaC
MVAALSKLHDTINSFTPAFNSVIDRFQATFDTCTASFGKAFEANVKCVAGAVEAMGANMDKINQNIELQKRLLDSLGSSKVLKSLEAFVKASERFSMITALLNQVEALIANLHDSTASLLNAQNNYSDSLALPKAVAEQLNNILDRFVRFETSINALGERLSDDQLLGNAMLATVKEQLNNLEAKRVQIESYVDISSEELAGIFRSHDAAIEKISTSFNDRLAQQADEFVTILNSVTSGLRAARTELIELFNQKFDVAEIRHEFSQLELLPDIKEGMVRTKDEASQAKNEAARAKEEATLAKDEASRAKDEAARAGGVAYQIGEEISRNSSDAAARTNAQQQQLHDMLSHLESIETQIKSILTDKERWYDKWFRHK